MKNNLIRSAISVVCLLLLSVVSQALSVYQVNAVMSYGGQLKTDAAFVILENDTSRYEEHGKGGYSLVLSVQENAAGSYTVNTQVYADQGEGQELLATPSVTLEKQQPASVTFDSDVVGRVELELTLVEHAEVDAAEFQECKYVECE